MRAWEGAAPETASDNRRKSIYGRFMAAVYHFGGFFERGDRFICPIISAKMSAPVKKRIFLLDDEAEMTDLVGAILGMKGYELAVANDPVKALEQLSKESFDAVVLDLMMPELNGFMVIKSLRAGPRHANTPIFALSARVLDDRERKELMTLGVRYLPKPVMGSRLVQALKDVIK